MIVACSIHDDTKFWSESEEKMVSSRSKWDEYIKMNTRGIGCDKIHSC